MPSDRMEYRRIRLVVAAIERGAKTLGIRGDEMQRRLEKQGTLRRAAGAVPGTVIHSERRHQLDGGH